MIISAGFREAGAEGVFLEQQITDIRKRYGMRILGPDCLGFIRPKAGLNTTFMETVPPPGGIAFISQSGALDSAILDWATDARVGFSMFASLGSMIDIGFGDLIDFLGEDWDTKSILIYMEGVGDARKFMSAARAFALHKPIIVLKPGRFAERSKAARSHTGSMKGDDTIYKAAFKRVGVVRVRDIADLFDCRRGSGFPETAQGAEACHCGGGWPGVCTGPGSWQPIALINLGGELADLSPETIEVLNKALPIHWNKGNPVDVPGDA